MQLGPDHQRVNNEGEKNCVRVIEGTNNHFAIHKGAIGINGQATKLHPFCLLMVESDGNHRILVTTRRGRELMMQMSIACPGEREGWGRNVGSCAVKDKVARMGCRITVGQVEWFMTDARTGSDQTSMCANLREYNMEYITYGIVGSSFRMIALAREEVVTKFVKRFRAGAGSMVSRVDQ